MNPFLTIEEGAALARFEKHARPSEAFIAWARKAGVSLLPRGRVYLVSREDVVDALFNKPARRRRRPAL